VKENKGHLLVVDDNELNRRLLLRRLSRQGFTVDTAEDGWKALAFLEKKLVDVVLLDVEMPGISGFDVLKKLRAKHSITELPIIVTTARTESADLVEALELGANDYVTKPVDFAVTVARIQTQLRLKRAEEARRESEERYALATAGSNDGVWDWDFRNNSVFYSDRWKAMLGYDPHEIQPLASEWFSRIHPEDTTRFEADLKAHLDGVDPHFESEYRVIHRDGAYRWVLSRGLAVRDPSSQAYRLAGSQTDITSAKVADPLTGLPNRLLFMDRLAHLVDRAKRRRDVQFAVLFLDLDRFKVINDSLGHMFGDQLLIEFAQRLERNLRFADTVTHLSGRTNLARLGGDEFAVLLEDLAHPDHARMVGERLIDRMKQPFRLSGNEVFVTASIGVALSSTVYEKPEDLVRDADTAMYRAKALGRGRVEVFDSEMRASVMARFQLETELRYATERKEFSNYYQPIVSLETGAICGVEALVRWHRPSTGVIFPTEFIPAAEEIGAIIPIGNHVLLDACRQLQGWHRMQSEDLVIAVNISARQFAQDKFTVQIRDVLDTVDFDPSCLRLEITESMMMGDPDTTRNTLNELKSIGVKIAIDDFGTGYASLSYLHRFPVDTLKIDRSFVSQMETDKERREIVRAILSLAQNLGLSVIAEGVETATQVNLLREFGCAWGQGFYFSHPVDASSAASLLTSQTNWAEVLRRSAASPHSSPPKAIALT